MSDILVPLEKVRLRLETVRSSLTPTERKLADYILSHADSAIHCTISELAAAAEVSVATVTRLAQNSGYSGYSQLRVWLAKDLVLIPPPASGEDLNVSDEVGVIRDKLVAATTQSMTDTQKMLNIDALLAAAQSIAQAGRIDIYGIGGSATVCIDIRHKFLKLGLPVACYSDNDLMMISSAGLKSGDLAMGISHTGRSEPVVAAISSAAQAGARTMAMTHDPFSPLARIADLTLTYSAKTTVFSSDSMTGRLSQLMITDILYTIIGYSHFERVSPLVHKADSQAIKRRINR
ncbi:MurR/RpiR family transcriptional regulator [Sodalis ligni]|uniref:MurR/RpiR family transcriptional regulator n=1 Tax=Sodalis ligni TaxID=2697027 RepID=UPI00193FF7DB|nr:MurR/RpiR family transcriptional regulator [Sodalis ligni]QWA11112.1 MurR/RpiR family transcriptional regulator [Sodalis ligni]